MQIMVKATFTIIDDDAKAKRTEVIEMVYPMDEKRNFLKSLIDESTGDTVLFNKIYTNLEDSGLFMSVPEKQQLEYLMEMVELHKELLNKLDKLDLKLNKLQRDINYSLSMLDSLESELWDVASGLDDVSSEIEINK